MRTPTLLRTLFLRTVVLVSSSAALLAAYTWKNVAITGGGYVSGIVFHPKTMDVLYARTDVGGAFRWDTVSSSWIPLNDNLGRDDSQLTGILSLALDPNDANKVYLACGQYLPSWAQNAVILRSSDRGATWARTNLSIKLGGNSDGRGIGERLQVDPNKGSILFLGTNQDGLWKSTDSGATWAKVSSFLSTSINYVLFDPRSGSAGNASSTIYVGVNTTSSTTLFRSTDAGATWSAVAGQPTGLMASQAVIDKDGNFYGTFNSALGPNDISSGAVWKLQTDSGTWTKLNPPSGSGGWGGISVDAQKPTTLVLSTIDRWSTGDEVFRSTDGGNTWKAILLTGTRDVSSAPWASASSPHWITDIEIDPFRSNRVLFNTGYGIFGTDNATGADSGQSVAWSFRNRGLEETVPLGLASPPSGAPLVSVIGDLDGYRHDDLNTVPSARLSPRMGTSFSIDFAENKPGTMVRLGSTGQYSTDGGSTWTAFGSTPSITNGAGSISVSADGTRFVWMPSKAGAYVSTNNGASWTPSTGAPSSSSNSFIPVSDRSNASRFYIFDSAAGKVYRSSDGGASFSVSATGLPTSGNLRTVPGLEGNVWLQSSGNGLYRSSDSGASFSKLTSVQDAYALGFGKAAPGQTHPALFLWGKVSGVDGLYRSDDTGASWTRINDDQHQFGWINQLTGDPRVYGRVYLATGGRGIIYGDTDSTPTPPPPPSGTAPIITSGPLSQTSPAGTSVTFSVAASGTGLTYQWQKNGTAIAGATAATLTLSNLQPSDAGDYSVIVASGGAQTPSYPATLVVDNPVSGRLTNLSVLTRAGSGAQVLIAGFIVSGNGNKTVVVRGTGQTLSLSPFNLTGVLPDPRLELRNLGDSSLVAQNESWGSASNVSAIKATGLDKLGTTPISANDAIVMQTIPNGGYTAQVYDATGASGTALVEVFDSDTTAPGTPGFDAQPRLVNLSARAQVGGSSGVLTAGFIINGTAPKRLLIRATGSTLALAPFNVSGVLADPKLQLQRLSDGKLFGENDNWGTAGNLTEITSVGGHQLGGVNLDTRDSVLLVTLAPGGYTATISGANNGSGIALVEVFELP